MPKRSVKNLILLFGVILSACGCATETTLREFRDLPDSHLVFSNHRFFKDYNVFIEEVSWSYQNQINLEGVYLTEGVDLTHASVFIGDVSTKRIKPVFFKNGRPGGSPSKISPDGKYIVLGKPGVANPYLDIVEDSTTVITDFDLWRSTGELSPNYHSLDNSYIVEWSRDSKQLAILRNSENFGFDLFMYDLINRSSTKVFGYNENIDTPNVTKDRRYNMMLTGDNLSWSSDGDKLAFSREYYTGIVGETNRQVDIFVYDIKQNQLNRITNTVDINERYPVWYPKNNVLTFVYDADSLIGSPADGRLAFSLEDGSCMKLLPGLKGIASLAWSPDGKQLAYISKDGIEVLDVEKVIPPEYLSPQTLCDIDN